MVLVDNVGIQTVPDRYSGNSSLSIAAMARPIIYNSPYPMPDVPTNQSISQFLLQSDPDDAHPNTVILADYDNPTYELTYRGLRNNAARDAAILRNIHGLSQGDVVCIYAQNSVDWASLAHGVLWAGGCFW